MTFPVINEIELVTRAQNGERSAFNELVRIHAQGVLNVVYRMCADVQIAEDAAQETFIQAWLHLSTYHPQTSLRNWLYRIAVNAATDMFRKEKRILPNALEDLHLTDHLRLGGVRDEAASSAGELGHERRARDDRRLLNRHRHEHFAAIDEEVGGDAERQRVQADDVLDHVVGLFGREAAGAVERGELFRRELRPRGDGLAPVF